MAKKKFDTNPLDPDFPSRVTETQQAETLSNLDAQTRKFQSGAPFSVTDEPTMRYENPNFAPPYAAPFDGQNVPQNFQTGKFDDMNSTNSHKVERIGLPENILTALPYLPSPVGLIAGVLELFLVPRSEAKVRFHAAQGLAVHIAILIVSAILKGVDSFTPFVSLSKIFWLVTTIFLIVWALKAFRGKPVHVESVDDLTEWLEDKIQPKK